MASLVINNTVQVRLIWQYANVDVAVNVLHGIKDDPLGGVDQARADGVANNIANAMMTRPRGNIHGQWKLARVGIRDLDQPNNAEFVGTPTTPFTGSSASELLPMNVCACVTLRTAKAGASYRGRVYLSGWTEGSSNAGSMGTSAQSDATALVDGMMAGLDSSGFTMSVASRKLGQSQAVTNIVCRDSRWDTQRRRIIPGI